MFHLVLTTCFAGILCYAREPDAEYVSAERCLQQGAILSGLARAQLNFPRMPQTSRIICSGSVAPPKGSMSDKLALSCWCFPTTR
jgi:hypothetical protein